MAGLGLNTSNFLNGLQDSLNTSTFYNRVINSDNFNKVKNFAILKFQSFTAYFAQTETHSNQVNMKTAAILSCFCIITLIAVSLIRSSNQGNQGNLVV
ncbi:MAG: hypothetical protein LW832_01735 [Parachlamydia sp.]|jgi:hypothetical protein|nr:hypothetical protein [Parachlamydia sp.]